MQVYCNLANGALKHLVAYVMKLSPVGEVEFIALGRVTAINSVSGVLQLRKPRNPGWLRWTYDRQIWFSLARKFYSSA